MEWVETTGRTLEEARDAALDMLGVAEADAEFVTLSEPRPGLFGRLRGEARVRARVLPTTPPPKRSRGRRPARRGDGAQRRSEESASRSEGSERSSGTSARAGSAKTRGTTILEGGTESNRPVSNATKLASGDSPSTGQSRNARRRRRRSNSSGSSPSEPNSTEGVKSADTNGATPESSEQADLAPGQKNEAGQHERAGTKSKRSEISERDESRAQEEGMTETFSLEEQGDMARRFIEGLVAELGLSATVTAKRLDDEAVQLAVDGDELGLLVGKQGVTLSALQELVRTVVQRKTGGHTERILVDVAGYRARRAEALTRFTRQVVDSVVSSGEEKALESMSPADRKVVHDAVNEIGGAVTRSEGLEPNRYVVISPVSATPPAED